MNAATHHAAAERALCKAVLLEPAVMDTRIELGSALFGQGMYSEAEANYREATRLQPSLAEAWFNLGLCRMTQRDNEGAVQAFQEAAVLKPNLTRACIRSGQPLGRLRSIPEAIQELKLGLQLSSDNAEAKEMLTTLQTAKLPPLAPRWGRHSGRSAIRIPPGTRQHRTRLRHSPKAPGRGAQYPANRDI